MCESNHRLFCYWLCFSPNWPTVPIQSSSRDVRPHLAWCPLPMRFFLRPLIGPQITWSVRGLWSVNHPSLPSLAHLHLDHCLAWGEEELPPSLPLGHGGDCLWAGTGPSNYHKLTNFHSRYLQQGPGPCDGLQEEGHDQQQQCHHDHLDARAARMEPHYSRI